MYIEISYCTRVKIYYCFSLGLPVGEKIDPNNIKKSLSNNSQKKWKDTCSILEEKDDPYPF